MREAAFGFADHSGWAIAVAVVRTGPWFEVVTRERISLLGEDLPRQPYHAVAEEGQPRETIALVTRAAAEHASAEVERLCATLRGMGHEPAGAGVPIGTAPDPEDLETILGSHMRLHAAEGNLFREALAEGAARSGLRVLRAQRVDVTALAADASGVSRAEFEARLTAMRAALGPPWQADHKLAAAIASLALRAAR